MCHGAVGPGATSRKSSREVASRRQVQMMGRCRRSKVASQRDNVDEIEECEIPLACLCVMEKR